MAYVRARWLDKASNTMMLMPTVGRLVAKVTASDPLALPIKAIVVVTTHDSISKITGPIAADKTAIASPMSTNAIKAITVPPRSMPHGALNSHSLEIHSLVG